MMGKEERRKKIMLTNLYWRLKSAFSDFDGTEIKVARLKSETEYLSLILSNALIQKEDILVKQLALDVIRVLNRTGTSEEKLAIGNILATYKDYGGRENVYKRIKKVKPQLAWT